MINKFSNKFQEFEIEDIDGVYLLDEKEDTNKRESFSDKEEDLIFSVFGKSKVILGETNVHIEIYLNSVSKESIVIHISKLMDEWFQVSYYECVLDRVSLSTQFKWIENIHYLKCDQYYGLEKALNFLYNRSQYTKSYILGH